jgi:urate oxidase
MDKSTLTVAIVTNNKANCLSNSKQPTQNNMSFESPQQQQQQYLLQNFKLGKHEYGKSSVRVVKVNKLPDRHELIELNVQILLEGDQFADSYYTGNNTMIVPTDTVKNTVFVLAKHHKCTPIEDFALLAAKHFFTMYSHVSGVQIKVEQVVWERLTVQGKPHHHAFQRKQPFTYFCKLHASEKGQALELESGVHDLIVAKTTQSGFTGYHKCRFTTLPETRDRIVRSNIYATWKYTAQVLSELKQCIRNGQPVLKLPVDYSKKYFVVDFEDIFQNNLKILLENFAGDPVKGTYSESVQQTLYEMGAIILDKERKIESVFISMPNLHCFLFDLNRMGIENNNEVFYPQEEPFGLIQAEIVRGNMNSHPERNGPRFSVNSRL